MQPRLLYERHGAHARAILNLVVPLAYPATAKRIRETASYPLCRSRAVSTLIGATLRRGDVDSMTSRSIPPTTRGIRTSMMATRTTTTRTMTCALAQSADSMPPPHAEFLFEDLLQAYYDCRRSKRNSGSALEFEQHFERNLIDLYDELLDGSYQPGRSICFVITRPKAREVWAAAFRDRIVHHLLYNKISPRFYRSFIADSCACIPERGTLYAATRLESKVRSITQNWRHPAYYLKCDIANFFVSIDKSILGEQLTKRIDEPWWLKLAEQILFHDPRTNYELHGNPKLLDRVPAHKRLTSQPSNRGLPIGNLSSQFFANVYMDALDQFAKHQLRAPHYIRYVDDFVLLHPSAQWLNDAHKQIEQFLPQRLGIALNPTKTILQPINRGIDFVGHVIKPWRRTTRPRSVDQAIKRIRQVDADQLRETANSYFGLLRQASHSRRDRTRLTKEILRRGRAVDIRMTKIFGSQR